MATKKQALNLTELGKRIEAVLRDYRFQHEPLKSPLIRREIAAKVRAAVKELTRP